MASGFGFRRFAQERLPVERQIGMGVLERFLHFAVQRLATDSRTGGRSKHVQDPRPLRALRRPIGVHDIGAFVPALVASPANERHGAGYFLRAAPAFAGRLALRAGFAAGRAAFAAGLDGMAGLVAGLVTGLVTAFTGGLGFGSGGAGGFATARGPPPEADESWNIRTRSNPSTEGR